MPHAKGPAEDDQRGPIVCVGGWIEPVFPLRDLFLADSRTDLFLTLRRFVPTGRGVTTIEKVVWKGCRGRGTLRGRGGIVQWGAFRKIHDIKERYLGVTFPKLIAHRCAHRLHIDISDFGL